MDLVQRLKLATIQADNASRAAAHWKRFNDEVERIKAERAAQQAKQTENQ